MKAIRRIILVIALIVFIGSAAVLVNHYLRVYLQEKDFKDLASTEVAATGLKTDKGTVLPEYVNLYKKNKDLLGWVKVDDTKIDYPVMQTKDDPEYYLRRNFKKEYYEYSSGTPFMDAQSDIFLPTRNWLIYGHNIKSGVMFHQLLKYEEYDFYKDHKTFTFNTIYKKGTYEVVAMFRAEIYTVESKKFKYYNYAGMTTKKQFNEYVKGVKALSAIDTGVTPKFGDQLVTLSTCAYHVDNHKGRFVVVGRRIK